VKDIVLTLPLHPEDAILPKVMIVREAQIRRWSV
jgi:hypothetical protein